MSYIEQRRALKLFGKKSEEKKVYTIPKVSEKKKKEMAENKDGDAALDKFFEEARKTLTGTCQCGCGAKSQKNDDLYYRFSICHIFPKAIFKSIATHPLNRVERAFFGGCHTNMDEGGLDRWPGMADWNDIKERFYILAEYLSDEERAHKFYHKLETLVYSK